MFTCRLRIALKCIVSEKPATNGPLGWQRTIRLRVNRLFLRGVPVEVVEVRDRLEALAREVRLISLGLFGIAYVHRNGDDTGPLIDFATQVEDKLLALALEIHPYESHRQATRCEPISRQASKNRGN